MLHHPSFSVRGPELYLHKSWQWESIGCDIGDGSGGRGETVYS